MKILKPFETFKGHYKTAILCGWLFLVLMAWLLCSFIGETHLFPTIPQVMAGFVELWNEGVVVHIGSSLALFFMAVSVSIIFSLLVCYVFNIPALKPLGIIISKMRYLPLTGIAYYITIVIKDARSIQVWVLVIFMSTFLITSLLSMLKDINEAEFDHARTLGCSRWEMLLEVVIKGRFDYVIELVTQNLAIVWMMLVSIESILPAAGGIGYLIKSDDKLGAAGKVIALQTIIILIGIGLDFLLTKSRQIAFRYSQF
jgi:ABC-type nitrate/sulfonate/bicarbonate transport system permease component